MTTPNPVSDTAPISAQRVFRKISWRLMPLLLVCYAVAYLDRINIGYAQLQMRQTLDFSDAVYGLVRASSSSATCCSKCPAI